MASIARRRNRDGSPSWDATVRVVGYPTACKSFRTKLEAELWASRTQAAAQGRTLVLARNMTVGQMLDEVTPRLRRPVKAAFAFWRAAIGHLPLADVSTTLIATHRDALLGASCRGHGHKRLKPRSTQTVRNYLIELGRAYQVALKELRVVDVNPVTLVSKPAASPWRVRFLNEDEQVRILAACKSSASPDLYPFVLFCLTTGCRKGEAAALRWSNVDLVRRWAVFPMTKNGTARGVPLTRAVVELFKARPRDDARVFPHDITSAWHTAIECAASD